MTVLFLDLATSTGWAVDDPATKGRAPITGLASLPAAVDGRIGHTLEVYRGWLSKMVRHHVYHGLHLVAYEAPLMLPRKSNFLLICLAGVTEMVCHQQGVRCDGTFTASTIKKQFTGDGHAKKPQVIRACRGWGWDVGDDDNRADAAAGWAVIKAKREPGWTPHLLGLPPLRELAP